MVGNRDVIKHGENGYIVRSAEECVELLKRMDGSLASERELRERAHADILNCYNIANMGENYAGVYRKLQKNRK